MKIKVIGSGSSGNATLFRTDANPNWVLFDCGSSHMPKHTKGYDIKAIFITHCHSDHCSKVKYMKDIPVYGTMEDLSTEKFLNQFDEELPQLWYLKPFNFYKICDYVVIPYPSFHDTPNPVHFLITDGIEYFFYGCDTCALPSYLNEAFDLSDCIMLECDYDSIAMQTDMIDGHPVSYVYDAELKQRISETHCSVQYIKFRMNKYLRKTSVILGHLSKIYNSKKNVMGLIPEAIVIGRQDCPVEMSIPNDVGGSVLSH